MKTCGLILLAAGNSTRLGKPKQLLPWQNSTLLQHAIQTALAAIQQPVVVVLGASAPLLEPLLNKGAIHIVDNKEWGKGMATSIVSGLTALLAIQPSVDAVIFMVCDQPYVTKELLSAIIVTYRQTGKAIVASAYGDIMGTPALFDKQLFPQLLQLQGDAGAKKIMTQNSGQLTTVPFPKGNIDIDTIEDYERVRKSVESESPKE